MPQYQKEVDQLIDNCIKQGSQNKWIECAARFNPDDVSIKEVYWRYILDYGLSQLQQDFLLSSKLKQDEQDKIILLRHALAPQEHPLGNLKVLSANEAFDPETTTLLTYIREMLSTCRRGFWLFDCGKTNGLFYEAVVRLLQYLAQVDYLALQSTFLQESCHVSSPIALLKSCDTTRSVIRTKDSLDQVAAGSIEDFTSFINNNS